ncbi:hypothetical protein M409DRAFT_64940 [Zasmidium cellare ATCC 36951]|uniref:Major facilitator superfamily (MFS) profile domain-containing protein n=1 Tax=Zasmidium cellare ATCC 36951 TaxID=1080233 RepID=A0A6A6CTN5_ZASCE|nr:uncharacterized protein M409DRAFT_64940 [Zasmidium cellare ATCC 36951]KAF2169192.1 hypothetical protein M409DRAFT_64940 [Zasmidium cellare ATCC 36951]
MFEAVAEAADSHPHHEQQEKPEHHAAGSAKSSDGQQPSPSLDLKRTASNVLSKVASRMTTRSIVNPPPPPDGGLKAWTQVAMGWLVICTTWGWINSYGAFQSYYNLTLDESASTISWIGSVQNFLTFFCGAFSGRLLDAGLFVPALLVGAFLQVLGIFMMSLSTKYWQLMITQGIMTGIGGGLFFTPAMGLMGTYFSSKRALAIGIATSGNSAGGMIYPVIVQQLLPKIGFAWTARVLGFFNLACLCLVFAFMRPRLPPRKSGPLVDFSAFKEPVYSLYVAGLFFGIWPIYYTFYYLSSYGSSTLSLPFSTSLTLTIIINGVGAPARIIPPFFADRHGQLNTLVPILASLTLISFTWLAVHTTPGLYTFTVFYGIGSAAFQCLLPSTVASITPEMNQFGTRLGMAFGSLSFAALTGPSLGGALQGVMGGRWVGAQCWAAGSMAVCCGFVAAARWRKVGFARVKA